MKAIDLTREIYEGMPVYPGTQNPLVRVACSLEADGFEERLVTMTTHTGTHIDAPAHLIPGGKRLSDYPAEAFFGPAMAIDCECAPWGQITLEMLASYEEILRDADFALLHTGWGRYWGEERYYSGYPTLTPGALELLAGLGLKGVGFDAISADSADSRDFPVHKALLSRNLLIIENLANLSGLPAQPFFFACPPLKIAGAEGAPCRAVAILEI